MDQEFIDQAVVFFAWTGASFIAGVGFAAYRAVGWVERIKEWALTCDVPIADQQLEGQGLE